MAAVVYLIPTVLYEGVSETLPPYILEAVKKCTVLFAEAERTARRFLKLLSKEVLIENYEWFGMQEVTNETEASFRQKLKEGKTVGIISEAGCPGVADPGQKLVQIAQELNIAVKPLVGPNAILLALMASGMNGQKFHFTGYLPIEMSERVKSIKSLEHESRKENSTQIFIETPYRNNQLLEVLIKSCNQNTQICVAVDLTAATENIQTKTAQQWRVALPQLHKRPAIFLLYAGT